MIPIGGKVGVQAAIVTPQPSRTWRIDFDSGRIVGMVDGLDAIRQAVYKILQTERFFYLVYSSNYGAEISRFLGSDRTFIQSEIKRRIREALLQDDRISAVDDFDISFEGEGVLVNFTVVSQFGSFRQEVKKVV
jgi:phage baseplate assembly protein W